MNAPSVRLPYTLCSIRISSHPKSFLKRIELKKCSTWKSRLFSIGFQRYIIYLIWEMVEKVRLKQYQKNRVKFGLSNSSVQTRRSHSSHTPFFWRKHNKICFLAFQITLKPLKNWGNFNVNGVIFFRPLSKGILFALFRQTCWKIRIQNQIRQYLNLF